MSIIGTWKVKKVFSFIPDEGVKIISAEDAMTMDDEEIRQIASAVLKVEDGLMTICIPIPAKMIKQAKKEGASITDDGMLIAEQHQWKEENGELFYLSGTEGTVFDEEVSPWEKLEINEDGELVMMGGMLFFEKE